MLPTVKFNDKRGRKAVKVSNKAINGFLAVGIVLDTFFR